MIVLGTILTKVLVTSAVKVGVSFVKDIHAGAELGTHIIETFTPITGSDVKDVGDGIKQCIDLNGNGNGVVDLGDFPVVDDAVSHVVDFVTNLPF